MLQDTRKKPTPGTVRLFHSFFQEATRAQGKNKRDDLRKHILGSSGRLNLTNTIFWGFEEAFSPGDVRIEMDTITSIPVGNSGLKNKLQY